MRATSRAARLRTLLCLAAVAAGVEAPAVVATSGRLGVEVSLEPQEIRVGDLARLALTVEYPAGGSVTLPELARGKAVQVVDTQRASASPGAAAPGERGQTTFTISVTSFQVGEHVVGGGTIEGTDAAGNALAAPVPAMILRTRSVLLGADATMRGVREPLRWPPPERRWLSVAVGGVLLMAAVLAGARLRSSRRRRPRPAAPARAQSPYEAAMKALAALRGRRLDDERHVELWHREVSSVVRVYLEGRFGLRAPELTTEELLRDAAGAGVLAPGHQDLVRSFLAQCDLVKFARHRPAPEEQTRVLAAAERLVRETGPAPAGAARAGRGAGR